MNVTRRIKPSDVGKIIKNQQQALGPQSIRRYHRMVVGPVMVTMAIVAFLTGTGPEKKKWLSKALVTKLGGRFSLPYNRRPSGRPVEASSIRNLDSGDLANAHTVIEANEKLVKVGPDVRGKNGRARVIMEREAGYDNYAVGWDEERVEILRKEAEAFSAEIALGRKPRYLPKSRIQRRV